jgi:murein L,D-transpeptidase YcbB/YkuD
LQLPIRKLAALVFATVVVIALIVAACSSSDKSDLDQTNARLDQIQMSLDTIQAQTAKTQALAAETVMHAEDMHGLNTAILTASEIDATWSGRATRMRCAVASVDWPSQMKDTAAALVTNLTHLESALQEGDLAGAKQWTESTHEQFHLLDQLVYPYIAGETSAPAMSPTPSTGDGSSPGAQNTPMAGM